MSGIASGLNKGYVVTKRTKRVKAVHRKGKLGERVKHIRSLIREVVGLAPYEKRILEVLKGGGNNAQKRAHRFSKKRLGTHVRARRKVAEIQDFIGKAAAAAKKEAAAADKK
jgi:large subunit ribosomal protein L36e